MHEDDYFVLSDDEFRALMALRDFADCAFCGYPEDRGAQQELETAKTFTWLVRDYLELLYQSRETLAERLAIKEKADKAYEKFVQQFKQENL